MLSELKQVAKSSIFVGCVSTHHATGICWCVKTHPTAVNPPVFVQMCGGKPLVTGTRVDRNCKTELRSQATSKIRLKF